MILGILFIIGSYFLIRYREQVVNNLTGRIGFAEHYLGSGGSYNLMVIIAILMFFWGIASITGTTSLLFLPLRRLLVRGV